MKIILKILEVKKLSVFFIFFKKGIDKYVITVYNIDTKNKRPQKRKRGDKMEWINFKVKDGERKLIKKDAYNHEMNLSEYLRWLIKKQRDEYNKEEIKNEQCN